VPTRQTFLQGLLSSESVYGHRNAAESVVASAGQVGRLDGQVLGSRITGKVRTKTHWPANAVNQRLTSFWMAFERAASETVPRTIFTSRPSRLTRMPAGRPPSNPNLTAVSVLPSRTG